MKFNEFTRHPYSVLIYCVTGEKEFKRLLTSRPGKLKRRWSEWNCVMTFDPGVFVVCLRKSLREQPHHEAAGILAHEAMHVWQLTRNRIDERQPAMEQEAYMVGAMVNWLWKAVK